MGIKKHIKLLFTGAALLVSSLCIPITADAADYSKRGSINGFEWSAFNQYNTGSYSMEAKDGAFTCSWDKIVNTCSDMGYNYSDMSINYKKLPDLKIDYNIEIENDGYSYFGVYSRDSAYPYTSFAVIEGWTGEEFLDSQDSISYGSFTSDGKRYTLYKTYSYEQSFNGNIQNTHYWSVRENGALDLDKKNQVSGTVTLRNHLKAFDAAGFEIPGYIYSVAFSVSSCDSSGSAEVKALNFNHPAPVCIYGDMNNDGVINSLDISVMRKTVLEVFAGSSSAPNKADLNSDGNVTVADLLLLQRFVLGSIKDFKQPVTTTTVTTTAVTTSTTVSSTAYETTAPAFGGGGMTTAVTSSETTYSASSETTTVSSSTTTETTTTTAVTVISNTNYNSMIKEDMPEKVPSGAEKSNKCTVKKMTYFSTNSNRNKKVNVILPPNYDPNKKYPVMYILHGIMGDESSMLNGMGVQELMTGLMSDGKAQEFIAVLPNMFTSKTMASPSGINQETCAAYDNFLYEIADDLMPFIEENFPVKTGRENTAITGFSMGGREAVYLGLMRPDLFGYVGGACPAPGITPGQDMFMKHPGCMQESEMKFRNVGPEPMVFMITGGTNDAVVGTFPKQYSDILTKNGVDHVYQSIPGGGHDASCVKPHLYTFMRYAFK